MNRSSTHFFPDKEQQNVPKVWAEKELIVFEKRKENGLEQRVMIWDQHRNLATWP